MALRKEDKASLISEQETRESESSDTDIDSIVAEYKHTLRVKVKPFLATLYNYFEF